jgi:hypothetical protein
MPNNSVFLVRTFTSVPIKRLSELKAQIRVAGLPSGAYHLQHWQSQIDVTMRHCQKCRRGAWTSIDHCIYGMNSHKDRQGGA